VPGSSRLLPVTAWFPPFLFCSYLLHLAFHTCASPPRCTLYPPPRPDPLVTSAIRQRQHRCTIRNTSPRVFSSSQIHCRSRQKHTSIYSYQVPNGEPAPAALQVRAPRRQAGTVQVAEHRAVARVLGGAAPTASGFTARERSELATCQARWICTVVRPPRLILFETRGRAAVQLQFQLYRNFGARRVVRPLHLSMHAFNPGSPLPSNTPYTPLFLPPAQHAESVINEIDGRCFTNAARR
jgi:hypothetical protein